MSTPYGSNDQFAYTGEKAHQTPKKSGVSKWVKIGIPAAIIIILAAVLGGVLGSRAAKNNSASTNSAQNDGAGSSNGASGSATAKGAGTGAGTGAKTGGGRTSTATSSSASASATLGAAGTYAVEPLPAWDWGKNKAIGMCLGNWLILEKWMSEDWFIAQAGADSWDEWDFSTKLGDRTLDVLSEHWSTWITEDDIETMYQTGINHLRIPTGFWAWIPTVDGEPYLNDQAAYQAQLDRVLGYAHARGMYAVIDLHGLPGSQNGEQTSGHNTTTPAFFNNAVNQGRSDDAVKAAMAYIENSPFRTAISGLEVINEPRPYTPAQTQELEDYYTRSYETIQASTFPVAMFIADGYVNGSIEYWRPFAESHATTPPSVIMAEHPYPGNFPPQTNGTDIQAQVCTAAAKYTNYPIPLVITEWGVYTGVKTTEFETAFYENQVATWAWSAGGMYWSYKLIPSVGQLAAGLDYSQYSFITLVNNATGTIPTPSSFNLENTTTLSNAEAYLSALTSTCGDAPANAAPYPAASVTWTEEIDARSAVATQTLVATSISDAPSSTATTRNRKKRSFNA